MEKYNHCILVALLLFSFAESSNDFLSRNTMRRLEEIIDVDETYNTKCFFEKDFLVYSLRELHNEEGDYAYEGKVFYNFCKNTNTHCKEEDSSNSTFIMKNTTHCIKYSGNINGTLGGKNVWEVFDDNQQSGIRITYAKGDQCLTNPSERYQLKMELLCNRGLISGDIEIMNLDALINPTQCNILLKGKSYDACSNEFHYIFQSLLYKYRYIAAIVLLAAGLLISIFGVKFQNTSIFIVSFVIVAVAYVILVPNFYEIYNMKTAYIVIAIGGILGVIAGFVLIPLIKVFLVLLSAFGGYTLGTMLHTVYITSFDWQVDVMYWVFIVVIAGILCLIAFKIFTKIFMVITSVMGAYYVINALSMVFGGIPNEFIMRDLKRFEENEAFNARTSRIMYVYLVIWILLAVLGLYRQCKGEAQEKAKKEYDEYDPALKDIQMTQPLNQ